MATFSSEHCASTRCKQYPPAPWPPWIVPLWTTQICSQSSVGWLLFSVCEDGLFASYGGTVCATRFHIVANSITRGVITPVCLCPADEGIDGCLSRAIALLFAHNHFCFLLFNRCCLCCQSLSISRRCSSSSE